MFFVNEWLNKEPFEFLPAFRDELHIYGFSEKASYAVALVRPPDILEHAEDLGDRRCLYAQGSDIGFIIYQADAISQLLRFIERTSKHSGEASFLCTIGRLQKDYTGVKRSFEQAKKLMTVKSRESGVFYYDDFAAELIFCDAALEYKEILMEQILSGFSDEEKLEFARFMESYARNNGSVSRIAEELFIHKNTVQYKINKILKKTGKDPRIIRDAMILIMVADWIRRG